MPVSKRSITLTVGSCSSCGCPIHRDLPAKGFLFAPPAKDVRTDLPICPDCELQQMCRLRRNAKARVRYAIKKEEKHIESAAFKRLIATIEETWMDRA
jgi:hypothetical protein